MLVTEWPQTRSKMLNIVALLLLTNVLLLVALLTTDVRLGWPSLGALPIPSPVVSPSATIVPLLENCGGVPSAASPAASPATSIVTPPEDATAAEALQHHLYGVTLNTSVLDTESGGAPRTFQPHGVASHLIIEFGAYRTGPSTFSVVALISQRLHDLHNPPYECSWRSGGRVLVANTTWTIKPDWELGTMYGTMVVVCMFHEDVGVEGEGGSIVLSVGYADEYRPPEIFTALTEAPGEYNASRWSPPFPYEYTFCVSRLYGNVSAQRIREWMAYHARLLGDRTHFLFHDAGGMSSEVHRVLKPWVDLGRVSIQNLRLLEVYEGRSHHQFTMLNDCMLRAQTLSNWSFFFDVDEYLYVSPKTTLEKILADSERQNYTQIRMNTIKMSEQLCAKDPTVDDATRSGQNSQKWAFEKLVFGNCDFGWAPLHSQKYMLKPRSAWATGVHFCEYMKDGMMMLDADDSMMRLYHYHGVIPVKGEVCRDFTNGTNGEPNFIEVKNCTLDQTMTAFGKSVKQYERRTIGELPSDLL